MRAQRNASPEAPPSTGTAERRRRPGSRTSGGRRAAGLVSAVVLAIVAAGCGSSSTTGAQTSTTASSGAAGSSTAGAAPGITAKTVTIGQVDTLSGPVPGLFKGAEVGTQAYVDYVNSTGGINGRKLVLDVQDDQLNASNYVTDTQQLVKSTFALVGGFSLLDGSQGAIDAINAAKIPDVTMSLTAARALDPYNYSPDPLVVGGSRLGPFEYYKKEFPQAVKHVGTLYTNVTASTVAQTKADVAAMESIGYHVSFSEVIGALQSDFTPEVLKMRQEGVQMVYIVGAAVGQVANLAKDMAQQDFSPKVFSTNGVAYDASYVPTADNAANGTETDMTSALYLGQDAKSVPAVALYDKWVAKVGGQHYNDTYAMFGWSAAELFSQALKAAGADPTRQSVLAALNSITSFDAGGLLAPGNPAQKKPETCWILAKVVNGTWQRTAPDPKSGYVCNPGGFYYPPGYKPFVRPPGA